jgi:hypothetical protein
MGRRKWLEQSREKLKSKDFELDELLDIGNALEDLPDWADWRTVRRRFVARASRKPDTAFPLGLGLVALLAAFALGGGVPLILLASLAIMAGAAFLAIRTVLGLGQLGQQLLQRLFETQQSRQVRRLDELDERLRSDPDPRLHGLFLRLSQLYQSLEHDVRQGNVKITAADLLQSIEKLFRACLEHLEMAHRLGEAARHTGAAGSAEWGQREELVAEVDQTVSHLESVAAKLSSRSLGRKKSELKRMRDELDETLRIAQRVDERMESLQERPRTLEA